MQITNTQVGDVLEAVRTQEPLVQCLTNVVVTNFTANALLALGASAAMADLPDEAGPFARIAHGVLINLGTPYSEQRAGMLEAASSAQSVGTPWVLDPVAVGALPVRTQMLEPLLAYSPTVIRGNASEIGVCAGVDASGRGVDATVGVDDVLDAARAFAQRQNTVIAMSGPVDVIVAPDGRVAKVANGSVLLTKVTGGGCALGAIIAACVGVVGDPFLGAIAGSAIWALAGEQAQANCAGPGSFAVAHLDAVAAMTPASLARDVKLG